MRSRLRAGRRNRLASAAAHGPRGRTLWRARQNLLLALGCHIALSYRVSTPTASPKPKHGRLHVDRAALRARAHVLNAYGLLLLAQLCMSSGGIFGRYALDGIGPLQVAALRMTIASLPLAIRFAVLKGPRTRWQLEAKLLGAGLALAVVFGAWTGSLMRLSVGASTLLTCTAPFFNGIYEYFVLKRRGSPSFWAALVVAIGSIALMVSGATGETPIQGQAVLGACLALASSLCMAAYYIVVRRVSQQHSYSTMDIITRTYGWAALALMFLCLAVERTPLPSFTMWAPWAGVLGLAIVTQGCGHTLQNVALKTLRPAVVSFAALSEPLLATIMAIFIFNEQVTWRIAVAGVTLLAALGWAMHISLKAETEANTKPATAS